jgi:hypothetical protein
MSGFIGNILKLVAPLSVACIVFALFRPPAGTIHVDIVFSAEHRADSAEQPVRRT